MNSSDNVFQSYVGFSSPPTCLLRPEMVPTEGRESLSVTRQGDEQQEQKKKKREKKHLQQRKMFMCIEIISVQMMILKVLHYINV